MAYLKLTIETTDEQQADIILAALSSLPFNGFEHGEGELIGYIEEGDLDNNLLRNILEINNVKHTISVVEDQNWNQVWESNFEPVTVLRGENKGVLAYIRAGFHEPSIIDPNYEIIITPKMSFGTGHHATTYQMVEHMSRINFSNKSVIDFGTGTGVLAILAEKMGASDVLAIECEDWTVENANDNIIINGCLYTEAVKGNHCFYKKEKADIILANINLNVIFDNLVHIKNAAQKDAYIIFSGLLDTDESAFKRQLTASGYDIIRLTCKDHWLAITAKISLKSVLT